MDMPMIVIVCGLPGSGKSYFASRLSEKLDATYISSDLTRTEMDAEGRYAFEDQLNVYEEMANSASEELRRGRRVVVEATFFRKQMRNLFRALGKLLHKRVAFIEVQSTEEIIRERLSHPRPHSAAGFAIYKMVKAQYEEWDIAHLVLRSKADNIESMLVSAMHYLSKADEESAHEREHTPV